MQMRSGGLQFAPLEKILLNKPLRRISCEAI